MTINDGCNDILYRIIGIKIIIIMVKMYTEQKNVTIGDDCDGILYIGYDVEIIVTIVRREDRVYKKCVLE